MLRRAPLLLALATVIILTSFADAKAEEARGPKIFGLQVGMPWEEAVQVAKSYAEKHGLKVTENPKNTVIQLAIDTENNDKVIYLMHYSSGKLLPYLREMIFFPRVFNVGMIDIDKIRKIFDRYDIPFDKARRIPTGLRYDNGDEGYNVLFEYRLLTQPLTIELIQKSSEMTLE